MDKEQCRAAKAQLVTGMQAGRSWQTAAAQAGLPISQSNAYRLWRAFRQRGETALSDGRHGHPIKVRGEVRTFLEAACRRDPSTLSSTIQAALRERFDLNVSISQINRVRAALGVSTRPAEPATGKKMQVKEVSALQAEWQEGAGSRHGSRGHGSGIPGRIGKRRSQCGNGVTNRPVQRVGVVPRGE